MKYISLYGEIIGKAQLMKLNLKKKGYAKYTDSYSVRSYQFIFLKKINSLKTIYKNGLFSVLNVRVNYLMHITCIIIFPLILFYSIFISCVFAHCIHDIYL